MRRRARDVRRAPGMRTLVDLLLRKLGYEIRRIEREPPAAAPPVALTGIDFGAALADFPASVRQVARPRASAAQLIVEGWRSIAHSYAVVNQWQLIAMAGRDDVAVRMIDIPFHRRSWKAQDGLFDPEAQAILDRIEPADPDDDADVTLRIFFPYDFEPSRSRLTAVFGTCEAQGILRRQFADFRAFDRLQRRPPPEEVRAVTPSTWSAEGFYRAGFRPEQVLVVPHGVDVATFQPRPQLRPAARKAIGAAEHEFVFLSLGAMTGNKGIDLLLRAFGQVLRRHPAALLVLKGLDSVYASKTFFAKSLERVDPAERGRVLARTRYFGGALSFREMAVLYQAADAYVSTLPRGRVQHPRSRGGRVRASRHLHGRRRDRRFRQRFIRSPDRSEETPAPRRRRPGGGAARAPARSPRRADDRGGRRCRLAGAGSGRGALPCRCRVHLGPCCRPPGPRPYWLEPAVANWRAVTLS